jgi:hypothetical protein
MKKIHGKASGSDCKSKFCNFFKRNFDSFFTGEIYIKTSDFYPEDPANIINRIYKEVWCPFADPLFTVIRVQYCYFPEAKTNPPGAIPVSMLVM